MVHGYPGVGGVAGAHRVDRVERGGKARRTFLCEGAVRAVGQRHRLGAEPDRLAGGGTPAQRYVV